MNVFEKLIRFLQDDYKVGVESTTVKPVIYIDPRKFDTWALDRASEDFERTSKRLKEAKEKAELEPEPERTKQLEKIAKRQDRAEKEFNEVYANEARTQFEEQRPGISRRFTDEELAEITIGAQNGGMYQLAIRNDLSLISLGPKHYHNMDELFSRAAPFKREHLREMPGPQSLWLEAIGAHEGRHTSHVVTLGMLPEKRMQFEADSDFAAMEVLIRNGRHDMVQAWIDFRAIAAANPRSSENPFAIHAVGIFISNPTLMPPTQQHLDAAKDFRQEMINAVAAQSGMKPDEAEKLRTEDPQKFVQIVQQALDAGKIPAKKIVEVSFEDAKKLIAADMGLTIEQFDQLGPDKLADINKSYDKLKAQGVFTKDETNPHIKLYVEQYVGAVQRRLVADTSPKVDATAEAKKEDAPTPPAPSGTTVPTPAKPEPTAAEKIAALTDDDHKKNAEYSYKDVAIAAVSKHLGISEYDTKNLTNREFIATLDELLKAGKIPGTLKMERSIPEMEQVFYKAMDMTAEQIDTLDMNKAIIAFEKLNNAGAFHQEYQNPLLVDRLKAYVDEQQKLLKIGPYAEPPAAEPAAKTITPDGTEVVADASTKIEGDVTARGAGAAKPKISDAETAELRELMYSSWKDASDPNMDAADRLSHLRSAHQVAELLQSNGVPNVPPALLDPKAIKDQMKALAEKALADIQHEINSNTDKPDVLAKKIEEAKRIAEILHGEGLAKSKEDVLARLGGEDHLKLLLEVANRQNPQATARGMTAEAPPSPATVKTEGGHYDYVAMLPNLNNGAPQIVAGETSDQITIGGLSASAYFQNQAHPELAEQQIALREAAALSMSTQFAASTTAPKSSQVAVS